MKEDKLKTLIAKSGSLVLEVNPQHKERKTAAQYIEDHRIVDPVSGMGTKMAAADTIIEVRCPGFTVFGRDLDEALGYALYQFEKGPCECSACRLDDPAG